MKKRDIFALIILSITFALIGWYVKSVNISNELSTLGRIQENKKLDVVMLNVPTSYYIGVDGPEGFEYDLLKSYADFLGVSLNVIVANTVKEALEFTREGKGDITSAALTYTEKRAKEFHFGPKYFQVQEQLICHRDVVKKSSFPKSIDDLDLVNIVVGKDTSYNETLALIREYLPNLNCSTTEDFTTEQLLKQVWEKKIDCTVADSNIFAINLRYYPELAMAMPLSELEQYAWILREDDDDLKYSLYQWFNDYAQSGKLSELRDRYYGHINIFDYYDNKKFHKRIKTRLPKYEKYFKDAAKKYNIPWTLLAAQSYQESHWDPKAKSNTGVRGMMMLTLKTAKNLGVKNRLSAKQSIEGGAKYMAQLIRIIPKDIDDENRLYIALAAYNVGLGHIYDARKLTVKMGKNPSVWKDLKLALPLLSQKKYHRNLKYGYARGEEPVRYVNAIIEYRDILDEFEKKRLSTLPDVTTKDP